MIVVSDTSPIVALLHIEALDLLEKIYQKVIIPTEVFWELKNAHLVNDNFMNVYPFIEIKNPADTGLVNQLNLQIDMGESEAIALAIEENAGFLLMDEKKGRMIAATFHLQLRGTLGILLEAKNRGYIPAIKPAILKIQKDIGFYISGIILQSILQKANEL